LRVLVVNEPELAESISRLRGEWADHSGGSLSAESKLWAEVVDAKTLDADIIVFPARYMGDLCLHNRLRPLRDSVLRGKLDDAENAFPLVRETIGVYGGRPMALPIAVQIPLFGYQEAWLAELGNSPPSSWQNYRELLSRIKQAPSMFPARESTSNWSALMLLARAAAFACHPQQDSVLFDLQTMEPHIADAPFVRALEQWRDETNILSQAGESSVRSDDATIEPSDRFVWAELPGAEQAFNRSTGEWDVLQSGPRRVPLLADGWLIAVTSASRNAASAFELAAWLASGDISSQLTPAFRTMLPCRRVQFSALRRGLQQRATLASDAAIAKPMEAALNRSDALIVPRIPGVDEYLTALSGAVEEALQGKSAPADALQAAADQWNKITNRFGREMQRTAYLNHLGIAEP
jgi:multiple sugar transport system substrate-binding protein